MRSSAVWTPHAGVITQPSWRPLSHWGMEVLSPKGRLETLFGMEERGEREDGPLPSSTILTPQHGVVGSKRAPRWVWKSHRREPPSCAGHLGPRQAASPLLNPICSKGDVAFALKIHPRSSFNLNTPFQSSRKEFFPSACDLQGGQGESRTRAHLLTRKA